MEEQMTKFTLHAFSRVHDRLNLSSREIAEILNSNRYVPIGNDGHRAHRLFYSAPDDYYFVAIQDERNGEVVTVLPIDYHNRWKVSHEPLERAKQLIVEEHREGVPANESALNDWIAEAKEQWTKRKIVFPKPKPSVFVFSALIEIKAGRIKVMHLGSLPRRELKSTNDILQLPETHAIVRERLAVVLADSESRCLSLMVRLGHSGDPVIFELQ